MFWAVKLKPLYKTVLVLLSITLLVSCGQSSTNTGAVQATALPIKQATTLLTNQITTSPIPLPTASSSTITFPTQHPLPDPQAYPAALISGQLLLTNGCIRINTPDYSYVIVWPPGFRYELDTDQLSILDATGVERAKIGQDIQLGGGEISSDPKAWQDTPGLQQLPPANCLGPYWYAAPDLEVVR